MVLDVACGAEHVQSPPITTLVCLKCVLCCVHSALNTTLGLGSNRIALLLQDSVTGSTLNTYLLTLHRYKADHDEPKLDSDAAYAVCGLRQVRLCLCFVRDGQLARRSVPHG
jgi:hypothetical protein